MATPFATAADLSARGWSGSASAERVGQALADASTFLRGEIGWQVYPTVTVTTTARDWTRVVHLPGGPVRSVSAVTVRGVALTSDAYELDGNVLHLLRGGARVAVTYVIGYGDPPEELVAWTCVLAADELARTSDPDALGGRPASEALADWRVVYSQRQQDGDLAIPDRVLQRLRSTYGQSVFVTS